MHDTRYHMHQSFPGHTVKLGITIMSFKETTISSSTPMPRGYGFLPKGIRYKTLHCRRLTREAGKPLFIVLDAKKKQLGLRAPKSILHQVHERARETLPSRRAATKKRDITLISTAMAEVEKQFPAMPPNEQSLLLKHAFRKHSGRVGRTGLIPLPRKVLLAVIAHVRHRHTNYDIMLACGEERGDIRKAVQRNIQKVLRDWGYVQGRK